MIQILNPYACKADGFCCEMISECMVENCYQGISTGFNGNGELGDSTTILKSYISNCYIDFNVISRR